ncbi:MAG TPA: AI-2E family transporter [Candidatus Paceibacterota bacterium]
MAARAPGKNGKVVQINVTTGGLIKVAVVVAAAAAVYVLRDIVLVLLASVVIAAAIDPLTRGLQSRVRLPRTLAVLLIYLGAFGVFAFLSYAFLPTVVMEARDLSSKLPSYLQTLGSSEGVANLPAVPTILESLSEQISAEGLTGGLISGATLRLFTTATAFFGGIISFVLVIILSFYLAVQERGVESFLRIVTPISNEGYVLDLWQRSQRKIGLWLQGQMLLGVVVTFLTFLGLVVIGGIVGTPVPNPLVLALLAGILEILPAVGPVLASIPAIAFGLAAGGWPLGLAILLVYVIVQQFENHILYPLVVRKVVGIPAVVSIIALVIGAQLAGFVGMLLSVPLAAVLMEILSDFEKRKQAGGGRSDEEEVAAG